MADLIVDRGAHAVGITFVVQGCRNSAQLCRHLPNDAVDLAKGHALADALLHLIQHSNIDFCALADLFDLLRRFDHGMCRNFFSRSMQ